MVVPYLHTGEFDSLPKEITDELMDLTKRSQTALREVYSPSGFNVGMNLGAAAGAGIVDHMHIHLLPRWSGDTNFMTTVARDRASFPKTCHNLLETPPKVLATDADGFYSRRSDADLVFVLFVLFVASVC